MARKRISQQPRQTILLVTASETEALYFSQMRKDCRYSNMTVVWEQGYKDLSNLITIASKMRNSGNFSCVWVVFGFADLGVKPEQVSELLGLAEQKKVKLAWNNPSLPLWYLLHLQVPKGFVQDPKDDRVCSCQAVSLVHQRCLISAGRGDEPSSAIVFSQVEGRRQCQCLQLVGGWQAGFASDQYRCHAQ